MGKIQVFHKVLFPIAYAVLYTVVKPLNLCTYAKKWENGTYIYTQTKAKIGVIFNFLLSLA